MRKDAISALLAVAVMTVLLGVVYPLVVTGIGRLTMPGRSAGSLVSRDGRVVGSRLIGQAFRRPARSAQGPLLVGPRGDPVLVADPRYFQPRPSFTDYAANATAFSNRGPNARDTRVALAGYLRTYLDRERRYVPRLTARDVPVDAVTDSGSGVDPHVSPANARIQARRVAAERGVPLAGMLDLVDRHTAGRDLGVLGEPRVNVLELNLALDAASSSETAGGREDIR